MPGNQIRIVDPDTGAPLPVGTVGEITIQGPGNFKGYWNKPEATAKTLRDGWAFTGDMGKIDQEGYPTFIGRFKEMIKVSGYSVFPEEVETILIKHPCRGPGRRDRRARRREGRGGARLHREEAGPGGGRPPRSSPGAAENMAPHKAPREVRFIAQLPATGRAAAAGACWDEEHFCGVSRLPLLAGCALRAGDAPAHASEAALAAWRRAAALAWAAPASCAAPWTNELQAKSAGAYASIACSYLNRSKTMTTPFFYQSPDRQPGARWRCASRAPCTTWHSPVSRYADDDAGAPHVQAANEAVALGATARLAIDGARLLAIASRAWRGCRASWLRLPERARRLRGLPAPTRACASSAPRPRSWRCSATGPGARAGARCACR